MKGISTYLAVTLLLAAPAMAQTSPGSLGGGQVGSGAVELPNLPQSGAALAPAPTTTPTGGTSATTGSTTTGGSGSSGGGGSGSRGMQMLCLSNGTVRDATADEFALSCHQ